MTKLLIERLLARILYCSGLIKIVRDKGRKHPKILVFHSVSDIENNFVRGTEDVWILVSLFKEHLAYIRKYYNIISLQALIESLKEGKVPERSAIITFDDGFSDNYHFAYPILKKHKIPATIFLTTEAIDNRKPIWIQKVNYLINEFGIEKVVNRMRGLSNFPKFEPFMKQANSGNSLQKQFEHVLAYNVAKDIREQTLTRLFGEFDISMENIFSKNKIFLSWTEINKLKADGICFGNHGESHTPFSALSYDDQKAEIYNSKRIIEQRINQDFLPFAYPFGQKRDFTSITKRFIDEAGHDCILTAMPTLINSNTSLEELGRIVIGNIPVYRLAFELEKTVLKTVIKF